MVRHLNSNAQIEKQIPWVWAGQIKWFVPASRSWTSSPISLSHAHVPRASTKIEFLHMFWLPFSEECNFHPFIGNGMC
jgi:hypothetical protein